MKTHKNCKKNLQMLTNSVFDRLISKPFSNSRPISSLKFVVDFYFWLVFCTKSKQDRRKSSRPGEPCKMAWPSWLRRRMRAGPILTLGLPPTCSASLRRTLKSGRPPLSSGPLRGLPGPNPLHQPSRARKSWSQPGLVTHSTIFC